MSFNNLCIYSIFSLYMNMEHGTSNERWTQPPRPNACLPCKTMDAINTCSLNCIYLFFWATVTTPFPPGDQLTHSMLFLIRFEFGAPYKLDTFDSVFTQLLYFTTKYHSIFCASIKAIKITISTKFFLVLRFTLHRPDVVWLWRAERGRVCVWADGCWLVGWGVGFPVWLIQVW